MLLLIRSAIYPPGIRDVSPFSHGFPVFTLIFYPHREIIRGVSLYKKADLEEEYAAGFAIESGQGAPAIPFRTALGALIIKEKLGITDEETVMQIQETPYLQYLVGMQGYRDEAPFDPSMMTHFRKRISFEMISKVNEKIIAEERKKKLKMIRKLKKKKILR
jgi:hypothetical protein